MDMALPVKWVSRDEFLNKYVARFKDLKGSDTGLPDSDIKGHYKMILNVFGFEPPAGADAVNPVGDDAQALISPKAGFSVGFLKAPPGNGPVLHNHDTNETFIPLGGIWRFTWEDSPAHEEFVDLGPYDTVSFPPGVPRSFVNVEPTPGDTQGLLMAVVAGDAPVSEAMPGVKGLLATIAKGELPMLADKPKSAASTCGNAVVLTTKAGGFGG
jgi:mannose-6-phosphate isomerase-like protein (cupin superfamily)